MIVSFRKYLRHGDEWVGLDSARWLCTFITGCKRWAVSSLWPLLSWYGAQRWRHKAKVSLCSGTVTLLAASYEGSMQWRSQDEQVTRAQHGHSRGTACLGTLSVCVTWHTYNAKGSEGLLPPRKKLGIASEAVFGHKYHFFSLTCMLTSCPHKILIAHASNLFLTLAFHIFLPVNFMWAQARVCLDVATPLHLVVCMATCGSALAGQITAHDKATCSTIV